MPGPALREDEWRGALDAIVSMDVGPGYFVASGGLPPGVPEDFYAWAADAARARNRHVIVDTSGPALSRAAEAGVFLLKPNMRELKELTGRKIDSEAELEEAAVRIIHMGHSRAVVVSLGAAGALLATEGGCERLRSPTVPIESKVGAGDSMVGGIMLGLARGMALREAVVFGVAAGAAAVMTPGTELCRREDAERLFDRMASDG
jgi:6-phosphofructokinase 2